MLTQDQANELWRETREAQVRSLYFADLGARYTTRKQVISGVSLFLAVGAVAAIGARISSWWIPLVMTTLTAVLNAYSISVGLDRKATTMAKLQSTWLQTVDANRERPAAVVESLVRGRCRSQASGDRILRCRCFSTRDHRGPLQ